MERANQTLQDRPVKEVRLRSILSMDAANGFSPIFMASFNQRFSGPPRVDAPAFRPWTDAPEALDATLARREERVLSKALTFGSAGTNYYVNACGPGTALRGASVTLHHFIGGGMAVHYKVSAVAAPHCFQPGHHDLLTS